MTSNLTNLKVGQRARIAGFTKTENGSAYRKKLLAMGLTPGTEFTVTRLAPMGDPVEIKVRGFSMSLRKDEATALQAEVLSN